MQSGAGENLGAFVPWPEVPVERRTDALEATEDLVQALLRTSLSLQDLYLSMFDELPDDAFPGENKAEVLLEMISGSACLAVEAAGVEVSRAATALIGAVMDRVLEDLREAARIGSKRSGRWAEVTTTVYTHGVAKTVSVRELRANLSAYLDAVSDRHEEVVVTRNGVPAAALISMSEYRGLEETAEILSDPDTVAAIEEGLAELERGETVTLDEVERDLSERRARG